MGHFLAELVILFQMSFKAAIPKFFELVWNGNHDKKLTEKGFIVS